MSWYIRELVVLRYQNPGFSGVSWSCIKSDREKVSLISLWSRKLAERKRKIGSRIGRVQNWPVTLPSF